LLSFTWSPLVLLPNMFLVRFFPCSFINPQFVPLGCGCLLAVSAVFSARGFIALFFPQFDDYGFFYFKGQFFLQLVMPEVIIFVFWLIFFSLARDLPKISGPISVWSWIVFFLLTRPLIFPPTSSRYKPFLWFISPADPSSTPPPPRGATRYQVGTDIALIHLSETLSVTLTIPPWFKSPPMYSFTGTSSGS